MNVDASSGWTNCLISTLSVEYKADLYSTYGGGQFLWCLYLFIRWAVPAVFDLQIGRGQKHICPLHLNSGGGWVGGGGVRVHILPIRGTPLQGAALRIPSGRCPKPRMGRCPQPRRGRCPAPGLGGDVISYPAWIEHKRPHFGLLSHVIITCAL